MAGGFKIDTSLFTQATNALKEQTRFNTLSFAQAISRKAQGELKTGAPWTDRKGVARRGLYASASQTGDRTKISIGGTAPNYKRGKQGVEDYLEFLEFGNEKKYGIVLPTAEAVEECVRQEFGNAALKGSFSIHIKRDKAAHRKRGRRRRRSRK